MDLILIQTQIRKDIMNEQARMRMLDEKKFNGDNSWSLADDAAAGSSMPDRFYEYVPKMLKTEVTISGGSCLGTEQVSTTAGKFDCVKISYLKRTKVVLKRIIRFER